MECRQAQIHIGGNVPCLSRKESITELWSQPLLSVLPPGSVKQPKGLIYSDVGDTFCHVPADQE
jgi:hypothetical protein